MITPHRTIRLLGLTAFLMIGSFFPISWADAAGQPTSANATSKRSRPTAGEIERARIPTTKAKVRTRAAHSARSRSMVAQAAHGDVFAEVPPAPLDGTLVDTAVRQVGHQPGGCGPVCDCNNCGAEAACGIEAVCGIEPVCGTEIVVQEPGCGMEVGCGIGSLFDHFRGSGSCGGCDGMGCDQCGEAACGIEEIYVDGPVCGMEASGDCSCDACASACDSNHVPLHVPLLRLNWNRFQFFTGVQGFKGPLSFANTDAGNPNVRSGSGSFGFHQGFNEGRSLKHLFGWNCAAQFGLRATQSNLSGAEFTTDTRYQIFVTYGLFRRVDYGLQYGMVVDYMNDDWYFQADLLQLRSELSWKTRGCSTYGLHYYASLRTDDSNTLVRDASNALIASTIRFEATDQYRLFYRRTLSGGGQWDGFLGWTNDSDALVGQQLNLSLCRTLMLQVGSNYLIPNQGRGSRGYSEEGWNVSTALVWRPGGPRGGGRYSQPLFDVADNGSFMVDRK